jgi:hypothetical protein
LRWIAVFLGFEPGAFARAVALPALPAFVLGSIRPGYDGPLPFRVSLCGTSRVVSGAGPTFDFFELFTIYFSSTSASLYALSKPAQEEIGMKKASANSTKP